MDDDGLVEDVVDNNMQTDSNQASSFVFNFISQCNFLSFQSQTSFLISTLEWFIFGTSKRKSNKRRISWTRCSSGNICSCMFACSIECSVLSVRGMLIVVVVVAAGSGEAECRVEVIQPHGGTWKFVYSLVEGTSEFSRSVLDTMLGRALCTAFACLLPWNEL